MSKKLRRLFAVLMCMALAAFVYPISAFAIDPIDTDREVTLTVLFKSGGVCVPGGEFSLFRVADTDEWANFTASGDFSGYTGEINGFETSAQWDKAAAALVKYAGENHISPLKTGKTDEEGIVTFSEDMKPGLYLLSCRQTDYKGISYTALPALVCLPGRDAQDAPEYDVNMIVKPGNIPTPTSSMAPPVPGPTRPPHLPQTGQLWWPIPVLAACGLICLVIGVTRRKSEQDEK